MKTDFKNLDLERLRSLLQKQGYPAYAAAQIFRWVYKRRQEDFGKMSDLSLALRRYLDENFFFSSLKPAAKKESSDGTVKFLFALSDGALIESVLIPEKRRNTVCLSSQVGCRFGCRFCASGLLGFKRNLQTSEIINQYLYISDWLLKSGRNITNAVFMGVGEPFDNFENVLRALRILAEPQGIYLGRRKMVVSTCGLAPFIKKFAKENIGVGLSVSLHSASDSQRSQIMPVNKIYPLEKLASAVRFFNRHYKYGLTFEYIMIKDFNLSQKDVVNLKKFLRGLNYKLNLIPYNPLECFAWRSPEDGEIKKFCRWLKQAGIFFTLRKPRGQDIEGACGQLRIKEVRKGE